MPRVSVIVPNYNHARFLRERLDSIFDQTYHDMEVILMDDHSSDESLEVIAEYEQMPSVAHVLKQECNSRSPFGLWRRGLDLAKGEYVWIAESDDVADSTFLEQLLKPMEENAAIGLVYCQSRSIDEQGRPKADQNDHNGVLKGARWTSSFTMNGREFLQQHLYCKNVIPNVSAVVFRKRIWDEIQYIPEGFRFAGDWMFWIKLLERTDVCFVPAYLNSFRSHAQSTRSDKRRSDFVQYIMELYAVICYARKAGSLRSEDFQARLKVLARRVKNRYGLLGLLFSSDGRRLVFRIIRGYDALFLWR